MDAIFIDHNGNKKNFLYQYDKGQMLVLNDLDYEVSPEVHFATSSSKEALVVQGSFSNGTLKVRIPDALLWEAKKIIVYLYINEGEAGETIKSIDINVRPRKRPADYVSNDGVYIVSLKSVQDAITNYINTDREFIEDVVVDYTTVHLIDDTTNVRYMVGINDSKLYIKEVPTYG